MASAPTLPNAPTVAEAYAYCQRLARTHYENFTVVSWLLPRALRPPLYSIYGFCRFVDDLGDEAAGDRLALLDRWEQELERCYTAQPGHPIMVALQATIRRYDIPPEPFHKLIKANRMDQAVHRHPTHDDLLYYCDHSANPVGHLVLYLCGYRDAPRQRLSDATCTALQLTNFWQDVHRDLAMDRIYIPLEDMAHFGYSEDALRQGVVNESFRQLMAFEVTRTREMFKEGLKLVDTVKGALKLDLALFSLGGLSILRAIERQGYDVLSRRPTLSKRAKIGLMLSTWARLKLRGRI